MGKHGKSIVFRVATAIAALVSVATAYDLATDKVAYIVPNAHLDTQWQWHFGTTRDHYIPKTMRDNFSLIEKYPEYLFNHESAFHYMVMKEHYRDDYEKLKRCVARGQWWPSGSMIVACDVLIPSPEALIRQILYGNGFFEEEFGVKSNDLFLPDCFGFGYTLPTIAAHCGLKGLSTQKVYASWLHQPSSVSKPFDIGVWEGVDGSSIIAVLDPGHYNNGMDIRGNQIDHLKNTSGIAAAYDYIGTGDKGGAPESGDVDKMVHRLRDNDNHDIKVVIARSGQLYDDITPGMKKDLQRYTGELLMRQHGVGCYTSRGDIKMRNHACEQTACAAEIASSAAAAAVSLAYPSGKMKEAWIRFLWHQMHDDVTGTSINQAYTRYSIPDLDESHSDFTTMRDNAIDALAHKMDTRTTGNRVPVVVFNSLSVDRTDIVEASVSFSGTAPEAARVYDHTGNEVPAQVVSRSGNNATVLFPATVPPMGLSVFHIEPAATAMTNEDLSITESTMENTRYRITINSQGDMAGIFDKMLNKELLSEPSRLALRPDNADEWPQWEISYRDVTANPEFVDGGNLSILERGPVRVAMKLTREKHGTHYTQIYHLMSGNAGDIIRVNMEVDWKSKGKLLKVGFPLSVSNPNATWDLGIGTIQRPNATSTTYEVPGQQWADITNTDNSYGVSILSTFKRGWHKSSNSQLHLTLIHSVNTSRFGNIGDQFQHSFSYGIAGHSGDWRTGDIVHTAKRFNRPLIARRVTPHAGELGTVYSFMRTNSDKVAVMALKKAEKSDALILRLRETHGKPLHNVTCTFSNTLTSAREVNGYEEDIGPARISGNQLTFDINGYSPKTFALTTGGNAATSLDKNKTATETTKPIITRRGRTLTVRYPGGKSIHSLALYTACGRQIGFAENKSPGSSVVSRDLPGRARGAAGIIFVHITTDKGDFTRSVVRYQNP